MKKISKPDFSSLEVFDSCISRVKDTGLKERLELCRKTIKADAIAYEQKAATTTLHTIKASKSIANVVSADEMKKVYTDRMAKKLAPGRYYYDKIMSLPEHGRCPLCSQRIVSTLDHHLPKMKYPSLAVAPMNLIPACQDCNKIKTEDSPNSANEETLHPYFDDVEKFVWIKASLTESLPVTIKFFVSPPPRCSVQLKIRLEYHFEKFQLGSLYSSHAAEELASIEYISKKIFDSCGGHALRSYLTEATESKVAVNSNSWQSALYRCLSKSNWFCLRRFK